MSEVGLIEFMISTNILTAFALGLVCLAYIRKRKNLKNMQKLDEKTEKALLLQSRNSAVTDMLSSIIHQWREPLGAVGAIQSGITARIMFGQAVSNEFLLESAQTSTDILKHLSETIETFHGFIKNNEEQRRTFSVKSAIETIDKIMSYSLARSGVKLSYKIDEDYTIEGNENEFSQVLINIISNDRDILIQKVPSDKRVVEIDIKKSKNGCALTIRDNAGGIELKPIEKVFEPSVSSKGSSGLGLYIAKTIIEDKFHGTITVANEDNGALFTIEVPCRKAKDGICQKEINGKTKMISQIVELENAQKDMRKWADIFSKAHWGIAVSKGRSNYIEMANPAFSTMHGYSAEEIHGVPSTEFFSSNHIYEFAQKIEEADYEGFVSFDSVHVRKDGSEFPVHIDLTTVKDADGAVLYRIVNVKDITEEQRQKSMLDLVSYAVNHVGDAIHLIDEKGKIRWVNAEACNSLGYTEDELLGMSALDIDIEATAEKAVRYMEALAVLKKMTVITKYRRKDGSILPVEIMANFFEYGGEKYALGIARDITKQLKMESMIESAMLKINHFASVVPGALYIYSVDASGNGSFAYASEKLNRIFGDMVSAKNVIAENCINNGSKQMLSINHPLGGKQSIIGYSSPQSQTDGGVLWYGALFEVNDYNCCIH